MDLAELSISTKKTVDIMRRKIAVVTGSRAEYGILKPLLKILEADESIELSLIVTGLHLLKKFGETIGDIRREGIPIRSVVEMYDETDPTTRYHGLALARGIKGFTIELDMIDADMLVVLGDRLEPLAATLAAVFLRIPVIHVHGGDKTNSGTIDESIRHSISRFAHLHLVAIDEHKERLIQMGEEPWRIHVVGSMGLDTIVAKGVIKKEDISNRIGMQLDDQSLLVIFHPVHHETNMGYQMNQIAEALKEIGLKSVIIYPNNDIGCEEIIKEIEKLRGRKNIKIIKSLPHDDYIDLMKHVAVMVGNSSSGIIEAASVKLPVVNIGTRQDSRARGENIINIEAKKEKIIEGIKKALSKEFRGSLEDIQNPYGDGRTAERIVEILKNLEIDEAFMKKTITH